MRNTITPRQLTLYDFVAWCFGAFRFLSSFLLRSSRLNRCCTPILYNKTLFPVPVPSAPPASYGCPRRPLRSALSARSSTPLQPVLQPSRSFRSSWTSPPEPLPFC